MALRDIFKRLNLKVADFLIISFVVLSAIIVLLFFKGNNVQATQCVIEINGEEYARFTLSSITDEKVIEIDNQYGKNTVIIDSSGVRVSESDCADRHEIKAGKITSAGQSLICLPHRLAVYLEGDKKLDGTAW